MALDDQSPEERLASVGMIVGQSEAMRRVAREIVQVAAYPSTTVLIQGESGTGKEVVAQAIHALSSRASHSFFAINCAAIPETLLETELFGVETGAYTDAKNAREGYLERASGGTLFLDEIGSMSLVLQAKLLRFLETFSFRRVGSVKETHVNLRIISATNVDLQTAVTQKAFREDLFYRLKVMPIYLHPLRKRREDIEPLLRHFIQLYTLEGMRPLQISPEAMELLLMYKWPGNIREMIGTVQRWQIMCDDGVVSPKDLPAEWKKFDANSPARIEDLIQQIHLPTQGIDLPGLLHTIERTLVHEALERSQGNQVQAAALLHITRDQLRYRLQE